MLSSPKRVEIDHRTIKLIVGLIALSLANLTSFFSETVLGSISASYYEAGWPRDIFIGFLYAISAFLLAYNGKSTHEMILSKIAAFAALGVAMFPCDCGGHPQIIPHLHAISAAVMFLVLAGFCYIFYRRSRGKGNSEAKYVRAFVYAACGIVIVGVIVILAYDGLTGGVLDKFFKNRLTFYGERIGLIAFGISWLTASRVLPVLSSPAERFSPFKDNVPDDGIDVK